MKRSEKLVTGAVATAVAASLTAAAVGLQEGLTTTEPPQPTAADGLRHGAEYPTGVDATEPDTGAPERQPADTGDGHVSGEESDAAGSLPPSTPRAVRIPAISVDAPLAGYGLEESGSLQVPPEEDANLAAWYHGGVTPGSAGTALINGHVDNQSGPAVFYDLGALQRGDTVEIDRADGRTAVFAVEAIEVFDRDDFPDELVYGASDEPELRLITCGGVFSEAAGGYPDNVVAFARLIDHR